MNLIAYFLWHGEITGGFNPTPVDTAEINVIFNRTPIDTADGKNEDQQEQQGQELSPMLPHLSNFYFTVDRQKSQHVKHTFLIRN